MELRGRLKLIAEKVPRCGTLSDIGTDHAYLTVYLAERDICERAVASDVNAGPLVFAKKNIERYELEDVVETRLSNGLERINDNELDVVVIAGMGGILISELLSKSLDKAKKSGLLVLQPMNSIDVLRQWLYSNQFEITDEELTNEGEKIYNVICAKWTGVSEAYSVADLYIGSKLIEKKDPLLLKLVTRLYNKADKVLLGFQNTAKVDEGEYNKYLELKKEFGVILESIQ